ncbi:UNVERIFIED_CONTAM: hypothetical protein Sangu_2338900, partial [Sesamum angustifolium]
APILTQKIIPHYSSSNGCSMVLVYSTHIYPLYLTKHFFHKLRKSSHRSHSKPALIATFTSSRKPLYRSLAKISGRYGPVVLLQFGSPAPRRLLALRRRGVLDQKMMSYSPNPALARRNHLGYNYTSLAWTFLRITAKPALRFSSIEILSTNRLQMLHWIRGTSEVHIRALNRLFEQRRVLRRDVEEVEEERRFREIVKDTLRRSTSNMGDFLPVIRWLGVGGAEKGLMELQRRRDAFMQELVEGCKRRLKSYGGADWTWWRKERRKP